MPTPTGDVVLDFTVLANTNPYTPTNFAKIAVDTGVSLQVLSAAVKGTSASGTICRMMYQGAMDATKDITATIEVGVANVSDWLVAFIANPSTGVGYAGIVNSTSVSIQTVNSAGATGGLISGSSGAITSGDNFQFTWNHTSHLLSLLQNGTSIISVTDATTTSGMAFGFGIVPGNNNSSTLLGFGGVGINSGATTITAASGTFSLAGQGQVQGLGLPVSNGTFALAGQAATLTQSGGNQTILAATGAFNLTGGLSAADYIMPSAFGTYALVGEPAVLIWPQNPNTSKGSLALLGVGS